MAVVAGLAVAITWVWATATGSVPLEVAGDESGRLLEGIVRASPSGLFELLASGDSWTQIHPPGDVAFRATVNLVAGLVTGDADSLVRFNQVVAALLVVAGVAGIGWGLNSLSSVAVASFLGLAIPSAAVIYVAHHALGENLAIALVGVGVMGLFRNRPMVAGLLVGLAGLVRPEAAFVFASMAAIPAFAGRLRHAAVFTGLAVGPAMIHLAVGEIFGVSYASVDLYADRPVTEFLFSGSGPVMYWGLGIWPWIGLAIAVVLLAVGVGSGVRFLSAGKLLIGAWMFWCLVFAWLAARGSIPTTQVRIYVFLHLLGALAIAVAAHEVLTSIRRRARAKLVVIALATVAIGMSSVAGADTRAEWRDAFPADVTAIASFLSNTANDEGILSDWMWWREFTVGVYGTRPAGEACNYSLCSSGVDREPPASLLAGFSDVEVERITQAWRFVAADPPRFITMFTDDAYVDWRAWADVASREVLSSFVRPLLRWDGACYETISGLPSATYCPVLVTGRYVLLERAAGISTHRQSGSALQPPF